MVGLVFILYTRYHIVARALGLAGARTSKGILHRSIYCKSLISVYLQVCKVWYSIT